MPRTRIVAPMIPAVCLALLGACSDGEAPAPEQASDRVKEQAIASNEDRIPEGSAAAPSPSPPGDASQTPSPDVPTGDRLVVGDVVIAIPRDWVEGTPTSSMRAAQYTIGGSGALVVFRGIGGGVEANMTRWIGQVGSSTGTPLRETIEAGGLFIHTIEMTGTYQGMNAMGGSAAAQSGTTFFGAIIEGGSTEIQLRLTVDASEADAVRDGWLAMVNGIARQN